jgi:choline transporter-like protein 2/4/5
VLRSSRYAFRYHLGSLLFGALILSIVQFIRFLLHRFEQSVKGKDNSMSRFFLKCADCILACFERFIKFLDVKAYIMVAIYGYSFCEGARRGFSLIASNLLRVSALTCVSTFLIFLGKLFVCMLTTLVAFFVFTRYDNQNLADYMLPLIVISILSYAIAVSFFSIFDMAADTLLLCFCEDCERNDGSKEKPYFMSKSLRKHLDKEHNCALCCC